MSDEEFTSEENADFSCSEDEWKPDDGERPSSSDFESEHEQVAGNVEDDPNVIKTKKKKGRKIQKQSKNRSLIASSASMKKKAQTLRTRMFNKYRPPPKSLNSPSTSHQSISLNRTLESSKYKEKKKIGSSQNTEPEDEESDSSVDDHLINPNEIDFKSNFFDIPKVAPQTIDNKNDDEIEEDDDDDEPPPEFDCNAGLRLSVSEDNDDDDDDDGFEDVPNKQSALIDHIKSDDDNEDDNDDNIKPPANESPLKHLHEYAMKMESAKEHFKTLKSIPVKKEQDINVSQLLAMGECKPGTSKIADRSPSKKRKKATADSESDTDWEEVQDMKTEEINNTTMATDDIQVTVQLENNKRDKKQIDLEAMLKRKLNRVIKENQINLHKVSLLCHIAHGIYCNQSLNNPRLMGQALKLLPNKTCYPSGRTEIKYFESMVKWFKTAITLKSDKMYSYFRTRPKLPFSLALQIKYKEAICKKDFVLIFIVLLRAMGFQCRMVMNLVPLPIRPAQSDLCKITMKKEPKKEENEVKRIKKEDSSNSKAGSSINQKDKNDKIESQKVKLHKLVSKESDKKNISAKKSTDKAHFAKEQKSNNPSLKEKIEKQVKKVVNKETKETNSKKRIKLEEENKGNNDKPKENPNNANSDKNAPSNSRRKVIKKEEKCETKVVQQVEKKVEKPVKKLAKKVVSNKKVEETTKDMSPYFAKQDMNGKENVKVENVKCLPTTTGRTLRSTRKRNAIASDNIESIPQLDGADNILIEKRTRGKKLKFPKEHPDPPSDSEEEFVPSPLKKSRPSTSGKNTKSVQQRTKRDRRVLSTDEDDKDDKVDKKSKKNTVDIWVEVFTEEEDQWISIDLFNGKVHSVESIKKAATTPIAYVLAWNNDNTIKDVSARYCSQWHTVTRKLRVDQEWLNEALANYVSKKKTARDKKEDRELHKLHMNKPLPTTITEYKNHPLYVLKRHLLKFEAIYPPNALTLGFVRGEPVYARECVHTLHSREIWLKSARVVKPGEKPYKIVKARPKWDRLTNNIIKDLPLEIFGYWQTMQYEPPTAENGIVPRNAYGNVELFKKCMLPKKTVHIQLPGLNKVCKKLKIDCAPAVVGFDFHQGLCHPLMDGFVVCEEYGDEVIAAWYKEQEEAERREQEKYEQRVYGNWKKLIKGLLIREKLKAKYNFEGVKYEPKEKVKKNKK